MDIGRVYGGGVREEEGGSGKKWEIVKCDIMFIWVYIFKKWFLEMCKSEE
jgi:hypothetical protein